MSDAEHDDQLPEWYREIRRAVEDLQKNLESLAHDFERSTDKRSDRFFRLEGAKVNHQKVLERYQKLFEEFDAALKSFGTGMQAASIGHRLLRDHQEAFEEIRQLLKETENR